LPLLVAMRVGYHELPPATGARRTLGLPTDSKGSTRTHFTNSNHYSSWQDDCNQKRYEIVAFCSLLENPRAGLEANPTLCVTSDKRDTGSRLGWMLVEYIELTDKCSRLRGPPETHTSIDIMLVQASRVDCDS
jgi:hypothetical protein